nr:hypothetical protein BaRGS_034585 [Batillaria attramentaria]
MLSVFSPSAKASNDYFTAASNYARTTPKDIQVNGNDEFFFPRIFYFFWILFFFWIFFFFFNCVFFFFWIFFLSFFYFFFSGVCFPCLTMVDP